jgi:heavy metal sensor kinase
MLTIKAKIIFAYTLMFGLMLAVLSLVIYERMKDIGVARLDARLESVADKLATEVEEFADEHQPVDSAKLASIAREGLTGARFEVFEEDGTVMFGDSVLESSRDPALAGRPAAGSLVRGTANIGVARYRFVWIPPDPGDSVRITVRLAAPTDEIDARLRDLALLLIISIPLALMLTAGAAWWITRAAFRPVVAMAETAEQISGAALEKRIALPEARDEIHALGVALNKMIARIEDAFRSQQQFVADASHEIRTPLTVIRSELEFAEQHTDDPAVQESIRTSIAEAGRLATMTQQLLLLAQMDAHQLKLRREPLRVDELVAESVRRATLAAGGRMFDVRINLTSPAELNGDRLYLGSVFGNLLDNATKYSPENTPVSVTVEEESRPEPAVRVTITDCGQGIPQAVLPHLFDRFYRGDEARSSGSGHGLGLAIAQRLAELHGGSVTVARTGPEGSSFAVILPVLPQS